MIANLRLPKVPSRFFWSISSVFDGRADRWKSTLQLFNVNESKKEYLIYESIIAQNGEWSQHPDSKTVERLARHILDNLKVQSAIEYSDNQPLLETCESCYNSHIPLDSQYLYLSPSE